MNKTLYRIQQWFVYLSLLTLLSAGFLVTKSAAKTDSWGVRITDIRDSSFTVSWITQNEMTGAIHFGTDPAKLDQIAYDVRGDNLSDYLHYVKIDGLPIANATYFFDIHSGSVVDDNGGNHYVVTTGPTLDLSTPGESIYGLVIQSDGETVVKQCVVYITLSDNNSTGSLGTSATMSHLIVQTDSGHWYTKPTNALTPDLDGYFVSSSGDNVELDAQCGRDGTASLVIEIGDEAQAPDMVLIEPGTEKLYLPVLVKK